jgi:hypothetical protein
MDTDLSLQAIQQARDAEAARLIHARNARERGVRALGQPDRRRIVGALLDALTARRQRRPRLTPDL